MVQSRSAKTAILASGQALTTLVGIVSVAILARLFSKPEYATYRQVLLVYGFTGPVLMLGLHRALYYFLPNRPQRARALVVENLLLLGSAGLLLGLFLWLGGNLLIARWFHNPALAPALLIFAPYPIAMFIISALPSCLMARDRPSEVAGFNVGSRLVTLLLSVLPCLAWTDPGIAVAGLTGAALLSAVAAVWLMLRACPEGDWRPRWTVMREQLAFGLPLGLSALAGTIARNLDKVVVATFCTASAFAVFVNGAMEVPLVGILADAVFAVVLAEYSRLYAESRTAEIVGLLHRATAKCATILIPAGVFLWCVAPELMRVLYGSQYAASAVPFRVYLLLLPRRAISLGAVLMAAGKTRHLSAQAIAVLIANTALTVPAVLLVGPIGAAWATVIATYAVGLPCLLVMAARVLGHSGWRLLPWAGLSRIALAALVAAVPVIGLQLAQGLPDVVLLALGAGAYGAVFLLLGVWWGLVRPADILAPLQSFFGKPAKLNAKTTAAAEQQPSPQGLSPMPDNGTTPGSIPD